MGCGEASWLILGGRFSPKKWHFTPPLCPMPPRSLGLPLGQGSRANSQWEKGSSEGAVKPCGGLGEERQDITLIQSPQPPVTLQSWSTVLVFANHSQPRKGPKLVRWGGCKQKLGTPLLVLPHLSTAPIPALGCPRSRGSQTDRQTDTHTDTHAHTHRHTRSLSQAAPSSHPPHS